MNLMNQQLSYSQLRVILPLPIIEEIIFFSSNKTKKAFRETCKYLLYFVDKYLLPRLFNWGRINKIDYPWSEFVEILKDFGTTDRDVQILSGVLCTSKHGN